MESMRDIDRVMEREITKGSCPLRFVRIEFSSSPYQEIASREKLLEVLSYLLRTGDYGRFAGKGTGNNVYMDIKGRKPAFKRTRSFIDRNTLFSTIRRYGKKIKPDFDGHTYLETVRCFFELPEGEQDKYRVTYDGQETFAFPMSDKYILGLYTHCISARRAASADMDIPGTGFSEKEQGIASLEGVRDVLFQCLFVCWVFTNSGVHNLPRTTAQGIYDQCTPVSASDAKAGDIIFFTGTYNSAGAVSHVGIYCGNGTMIHCGDPISYASINSSYWQSHFYSFGRLN